MKEKYWFAVLMIVNWRMELMDRVFWILSSMIRHMHNIKLKHAFVELYSKGVKHYFHLSEKRDGCIGKCKDLYWNWIEKPFLIRW